MQGCYVEVVFNFVANVPFQFVSVLEIYIGTHLLTVSNEALFSFVKIPLPMCVAQYQCSPKLAENMQNN